MLTSNDSLKVTTFQPLHRIYVSVRTKEQWYAVIRECRECFGTNWKAQAKVRRKLESFSITKPITVWFDVPEKNFGSWVSIKLALEVSIK